MRGGIMVTNEFINGVLYEIREEIKRQEGFIEKLKNYNKELDSKGFRKAYSLETLANEMENNKSSLHKAIRNLPMEEDQID